MNQSLIVRYTSNWPAPFTPAAELFHEGPRRQRQMIAVAERQIDAQKKAAHEIARSSLAGAQVMARELHQQTDTMTSAIGELGSKLSGDFLQGASDVAFAIDCLGDRICGSLDEIRWQLAQQERKLDRLLTTLLNSRNNEAQQLVRQGVRHYDNGEYGEAEERFGLALKFDSTDYQVLLNLAFIEIHKDVAAAAYTYFRKALTLPDSLDDAARTRALRAWARLHYAKREYGKAHEIEDQALAIETTPTAGSLFTAGVYAGLAGNSDLCLKRIRAAIETDSTFFTKAAVEPDLDNLRPRVLQLLSEMASKAEAEARTGLASLRREFDSAMTSRFASSFQDLLEIVRQHLAQADDLLKTASFKDCLGLKDPTKALHDAIVEIVHLEPLYEGMASAQASMQKAEVCLGNVKEKYGIFVKETPVRDYGCLLPATMYVLTGLCCFVGTTVLPGHSFADVPISSYVSGVALWPLFILGAFFFDNPDETTGFFVGLLGGLAVSAALNYVLRILPDKALKTAQEENARKRDLIAKSESELNNARIELGAATKQIESQRKRIAQQLSSIAVGLRI